MKYIVDCTRLPGGWLKSPDFDTIDNYLREILQKILLKNPSDDLFSRRYLYFLLDVLKCKFFKDTNQKFKLNRFADVIIHTSL